MCLPSSQNRKSHIRPQNKSFLVEDPKCTIRSGIGPPQPSLCPHRMLVYKHGAAFCAHRRDTLKVVCPQNTHFLFEPCVLSRHGVHFSPQAAQPRRPTPSRPSRFRTCFPSSQSRSRIGPPTAAASTLSAQNTCLWTRHRFLYVQT